ncbi:MAG: GspH/FimT family pseudopilin [Pseudomonadota bacterium]
MDRNGFTLIEMLVVLAVLGLAVAVFAPAMRKHPEISADSSARSLAAALERSRSRAVAGNTETRTLVDARARAENGLKVVLDVAVSEVEGEAVGGIRFYPDGSSSGGRITFDDGRAAVTVGVDWLTGGVDVHRQ